MHHPTDRITHTMTFVTPVVEHWLEREIAQWVHPMKDRSDDPPHHERTSVVRAFAHGAMGRQVHIKEPLLLIGKSSPCGGSGFPLSLSKWSFTICLMPYNRNYVLLLNKIFPSLPKVFFISTQSVHPLIWDGLSLLRVRAVTNLLITPFGLPPIPYLILVWVGVGFFLFSKISFF